MESADFLSFPILVVGAADHVKHTVTFSKLVISLGHWNMQRNSGSQSDPTRILSLQVSEKNKMATAVVHKPMDEVPATIISHAFI